MLSRHLTLLPASLIAAGLTLLLVAGCSNSSNQTVESPQVQEIQETPTPPSAELIFQQALSAAYNASTLTQDAKSINDWEAVSQGWQSAIDQLSSIPESSEKYEQAQQKIEEYQTNLDYAQQEIDKAKALAESASKAQAVEVYNEAQSLVSQAKSMSSLRESSDLQKQRQCIERMHELKKQVKKLEGKAEPLPEEYVFLKVAVGTLDMSVTCDAEIASDFIVEAEYYLRKVSDRL